MNCEILEQDIVVRTQVTIEKCGGISFNLSLEYSCLFRNNRRL